MAAWRNHPRHRIAQQAGRDKWYANYTIEIAEVVRESAFQRQAAT
jgi:heme-degrading monooxygenase HmoA